MAEKNDSINPDQLDKVKVERSEEEILSFWENPDNIELIVNAEPLESFNGRKIIEELKSSSESMIDSKNPQSKGPSPVSYQGCSLEVERPRKMEMNMFQLTSTSSSTTSSTTSGEPKRMKNEEVFLATQAENISTIENLQLSHRDDEENITLVSEHELSEFPACCVGKLFWLVEKKGKVVKVRWSTGFIIDDQKIMTVAHIYFKVEKKGLKIDSGVFVPAMIDQYDIYGTNFGYYAVKNFHKCTSYVNLNKLTREYSWIQGYDFATVELGKAKKVQNYNDEYLQCKDLTRLKALAESLTFIDAPEKVEFISLNNVNLNDTSVTIYGYGRINDGTDPKDNGSCMTKVTCSIIEENELVELLEEEEEEDASAQALNLKQKKVPAKILNPCNIIAVNVSIREGMSGGPWMQSQGDGQSQAAVGIQCASSIDNTIKLSISPKIKSVYTNYNMD